MSKHVIEDIDVMCFNFGFTEAARKMTPEMRLSFFDFRKSLLREETKELEDSVTPEDKVDALIDIVVIALGTLSIFGVNTQEAWDEVLRANMSKKPGLKPGRPNPFGCPDMLKPDGWQGPNHSNNTGIIP